MADVVAHQQIILKVTDPEWRLIMKSLAHLAGLKVTLRPDEVKRAASLNKTLLDQRVAVLREQLKVAEGALGRADEPAGFTEIPLAEP